ncbi:MAG: hypothetical protein J5865_03495, partial [Lachnospiraceae bacterium]|nr:hypothetical protein [Lachnospiraceae bacterium]
ARIELSCFDLHVGISACWLFPRLPFSRSFAFLKFLLLSAAFVEFSGLDTLFVCQGALAVSSGDAYNNTALHRCQRLFSLFFNFFSAFLGPLHMAFYRSLEGKI